MRRSGSDRAAVLLAVLVALGLLLPGLGSPPLDDPGEGQQAEIARDLWARGDPLELRLNGVRYYDKPPLLYWLGAAAFSVAGPTEWAARLGPALGAALAVAGTALLGTRLLGTAWGLAAGVALASSALFLVHGRYVRPETLFVAGIQWGFTGLLLAGEGHAGRRWAVAGCAALGVAGLAKDVLGTLGPLLAVGVARALAGRFRPVSAWLPPVGIAVMLGLGLGWYALVAIRDPGFAWYVLVDNLLLNVARARRFPDQDVPLSALEFAAVAGLGALPWTIAAALMIAALAHRRAWRDPGEIPWTALGAWAVGVFAVFTLSPFRLPHYGLPAYPAVALLAARWWRDRAAAAPRRAIAIHAILFAVLAAALAAAGWSDGRVFLDAVLSASDVYTRNEAAEGAAAPGIEWAALGPIVRQTAVVFTAAAAALAGLAWGRAPRAALGVVAAAALAATIAATTAMDASARSRSVAHLAAEIRSGLGPHEILVHEGPIEHAGGLEFYSGRRPILLEARRSVLGFGATYPDAADTFWDRERFRREWLAGRPIVLITPRDPARSVVSSLPPETVQVIRQHNGRTLYRQVAGRHGG